MDEPDQPPTDEPETPPVDEPDQPPTEEPDTPPVDEPDQPPTDEPETPPVDEPDQPPTEEPETPPTENTDKDPVTEPEKNPTENTDKTPTGSTDKTETVVEKDFFFIDVEKNPKNWKYQAVKYVYDRSIMGAVGASKEFQPDNTLTRAMFATVLYRMAGEPAITYQDKFSDVANGKWYSNAILWANSQGIVSGYTNGSYGINDNITREQIAKMLYLYGEKKGYEVKGRAALDDFTDKSKVSNWATDFMQWAVDAKMISGKPNGDGTFRLDPKGQATRAECAKMLSMFLQKYN